MSTPEEVVNLGPKKQREREREGIKIVPCLVLTRVVIHMVPDKP